MHAINETTKIEENESTVSPLYHLLSDRCDNNIFFHYLSCILVARY